MEKNRFLKIIIIFLLVLNLGMLAVLLLGNGPGRRDHPPHGEGGPAKFIIKELGLDENQQALFNDLKKEHQQQMRQLQDSMRMQREMLPDIIVEGNNAKADSVAAAIGRYQQQIEYDTYQHFVKVRSICTESQKKKFKTIIDEILKMMGPPKEGPGHR
jgi:protein CpxP